MSPRRLQRAFTPESPARIRARLAREASVGLGITEAAINVGALVAGAVILVAIAQGDLDCSTDPAAGNAPAIGVADPLALRRAEAKRARDELPRTSLHATTLGPGESVRGELWFQALLLDQAVPSTEVEETASAWSITSTPRQPAIEYSLRLRLPGAAGQEIDYFIARQ